jgi:hypothetical protein
MRIGTTLAIPDPVNPVMAYRMPAGRARTALVALLVSALAGCAASQEQSPLDAAPPMPDAADGCPARPSTATASPSSVPEAVALANGLLGNNPSLSIDCFLSALARPLTVVGSVSTFSLQPSVNGAHDPRLFIFSGNLMLSVVPSGSGSPFVELAETTTPLRSIKAQMGPFPLTAPIAAAAPYDDIRQNGGTVCGSCHPAEEVAPQVSVTAAFDSAVLQPFSNALVPLGQMQDDAAACDPQQDPARCAILKGVFSHGAVTAGAFPDDAQTF